MRTTLGVAARHPGCQLEAVDDAAGFAGVVDEEESEELDFLSDELDGPDDFCDEPDESEDSDPLVAEPDVTEEPARESVR